VSILVGEQKVYMKS